MRTTDVVSCLISIYEIKLKIALNKNNEIINCDKDNKLNLLKEIYKRLIVPFYIPILMLIPYFLILSSKERKNYSKLKTTTFIIGVITIILSEGIIRFIKIELHDNLLIFTSPIIFFLILYSLFLFKLNLKK